MAGWSENHCLCFLHSARRQVSPAFLSPLDIRTSIVRSPVPSAQGEPGSEWTLWLQVSAALTYVVAGDFLPSLCWLAEGMVRWAVSVGCTGMATPLLEQGAVSSCTKPCAPAVPWGSGWMCWAATWRQHNKWLKNREMRLHPWWWDLHFPILIMLLGHAFALLLLYGLWHNKAWQLMSDSKSRVMLESFLSHQNKKL